MSNVNKHIRPGPSGSIYENPNDVVAQHFFDPLTPNDPAFSAVQTPYQMPTADPIGAIMSDLKEAQAQLKNNGGK
jgi:hypothetical protein